jgi:hypothetical protein
LAPNVNAQFATGQFQDGRKIVIKRMRDEFGDWRVYADAVGQQDASTLLIGSYLCNPAWSVF